MMQYHKIDIMCLYLLGFSTDSANNFSTYILCMLLNKCTRIKIDYVQSYLSQLTHTHYTFTEKITREKKNSKIYA